VCTAGDTEACKRVKFTETGSFLGGIVGGAAAASVLTAPAVGTICLMLGAPSAGLGTIACAVAVVGVGAFAGGTAVGSGGEILGEVIYESLK
jgi:hypothetical protein